jgi:DNA-binding MarR family transcriptional regulator
VATAAEQPPPTLLYVVKQVELAIRAHLDELLRPGGLTSTQYTALTVLERQPDLTSAQLARNSFVTSQSMADMVTALEGQGLIKRKRDASDRRRLVLSLTADGRRVLRRYRPKVAAVEAQMVSELGPRRTAELRRSLLSCRTALADEPAH